MPRSDPQQTSPDYIKELPNEIINLISEYSNSFHFIIIPIEILADHRLSHVEKLLMGIAMATDKKEDKHSFWSNKKLAAILNVCEQQITNGYTTLANLGAVNKSLENKYGRTIRTIKSNLKIGIRGGSDYKPGYRPTISPVIEAPIATISPVIANSKNLKDNNKDLKPSRLRAADRRALKTPSSKKHYPSDSLEFQLAMLHVSLIRQWNESFPRPDINKWAADFDFLLNIRKFSYPRIEAVLKFWQADEFWRDKGAGEPNYLRRPKKFEELEFKAVSAGRKKLGKAFGKQSGYQVNAGEYSRLKTHVLQNGRP